jgi:hypothetical protein
MSVLLILALKALVGGTFVCAFAAIGEVLRPRGLAGIFSAAPSVALASLAVSSVATGAGSAASQATAMVAGSAALVTFCLVGIESVKRFGAMHGAIAASVAWFAVAIGLWAVVLR